MDGPCVHVVGLSHWTLALNSRQTFSRHQRGENSLKRAAEDAGMSLYDMMDELRRRGTALEASASGNEYEEILALLDLHL